MSTAERSSPVDITINPIFRQHLSAYEYAAQFVKEKKVLELGCGEGYGTVLLAQSASKICALDYSKTAIEKAKKNYQVNNLEFICRDVNRLNFEPDSFEVIVAFQFIEHLKKPEPIFLSISNLLKSPGIFLSSTPNKKASLVQQPYHFKEYDKDELQQTLKNYFANVAIYGLQFSQRVAAFREKRRQASQSLLRLDFMKLHRLLPRFIRQKAFDLAAAKLSEKIYLENRDLVESITTADYWVSDKDIDSAIDLISVCQK